MKIGKKLFAFTIILMGFVAGYSRLSAGYLSEEQFPDAEQQWINVKNQFAENHVRLGNQLALSDIEYLRNLVANYYARRGPWIKIRLNDMKAADPFPGKTFTLRLTTNMDSFNDLTTRLRQMFDIPENRPLTYFMIDWDGFTDDRPGNSSEPIMSLYNTSMRELHVKIR